MLIRTLILLAFPPGRSDAPFQSDGYEALIFDGIDGVGDDPDVAWVRINAGTYATVQFAFKKSWAGDAFMYGAFSGWD
ncbi:MAG: hypothetical protein U0V02_05380 [Anaerolineales bacterium]